MGCFFRFRWKRCKCSLRPLTTYDSHPNGKPGQASHVSEGSRNTSVNKSAPQPRMGVRPAKHDRHFSLDCCMYADTTISRPE